MIAATLGRDDVVVAISTTGAANAGLESRFDRLDGAAFAARAPDVRNPMVNPDATPALAVSVFQRFALRLDCRAV